jgi:hypothetical protein
MKQLKWGDGYYLCTVLFVLSKSAKCKSAFEIVRSCSISSILGRPIRPKKNDLVTHGISIRELLGRYFRYTGTIGHFNILANPRNCEMVVLGHNGYLVPVCMVD